MEYTYIKKYGIPIYSDNTVADEDIKLAIGSMMYKRFVEFVRTSGGEKIDVLELFLKTKVGKSLE